MTSSEQFSAGMPATRRSGLKRAVALVAGLVGLHAADTAAAAPRHGGGQSRRLELRARSLHRNAPERSAAEPFGRGDRLLGGAELFDAVSGRRVGELHAAGIALQGAESAPSSAERLEHHTFVLRDGTIVGSGTSGRLEGVFAVTGGTGRYAGARGAYVARQRPVELDGDGGAEFEFDLILP